MERLLENIVGMGFLVLGVQTSMTETVDMTPCQLISGQSQKLSIIRLKYNFDTHHLLILCHWLHFLLLETPVHRNKLSYWAFPTVVLVLQS